MALRLVSVQPELSREPYSVFFHPQDPMRRDYSSGSNSLRVPSPSGSALEGLKLPDESNTYFRISSLSLNSMQVESQPFMSAVKQTVSPGEADAIESLQVPQLLQV